jgi:tRNA(Ile)-lysidine synthetase-like protein
MRLYLLAMSLFLLRLVAGYHHHSAYRLIRQSSSSIGIRRPLKARVASSSSGSLNNVDVDNILHSTIVKRVEDEVYMNLIESCGLSNQNHRGILVCVSGGADSVALLHILASLRHRWKPSLHVEVAHFNHKMREESDLEESFVHDWAVRYNMPFHTRSLPIEDRTSVGLQATARAWRRSQCELITTAALSSSSSSISTSGKGDENGDGDGMVIATAHHADDLTETILMRLLRGAHISSLSPMSIRRDEYIKPCLSLKKSSLLSYLNARNLVWHEDNSNKVPTYTRNALRLNVLPGLESIAGSADALQRRLLWLSEQSHDLNLLLQRECTSFFKDNSKNIRVVEDPKLDICAANCECGNSVILVELPCLPLQELPVLVRDDILHKTMLFVTNGNTTACSADITRIVQLIHDKHNGNGRVLSLNLFDGWVARRVGEMLRISKSTYPINTDTATTTTTTTTTATATTAAATTTTTTAAATASTIRAGSDTDSDGAGSGSCADTDGSSSELTKESSFTLYSGKRAFRLYVSHPCHISVQAGVLCDTGNTSNLPLHLYQHQHKRDWGRTSPIIASTISNDFSTVLSLPLPLPLPKTSDGDREIRLQIRPSIPGDSFAPAWRAGSVKRLVDFMRDEGIPMHIRDQALVVSSPLANLSSSLIAVLPLPGIAYCPSLNPNPNPNPSTSTGAGSSSGSGSGSGRSTDKDTVNMYLSIRFDDECIRTSDGTKVARWMTGHAHTSEEKHGRPKRLLN